MPFFDTGRYGTGTVFDFSIPAGTGTGTGIYKPIKILISYAIFYQTLLSKFLYDSINLFILYFLSLYPFQRA